MTEVTRGERYSTAADIYQCGLLAYELLTRNIPFSQYDAAAAAVRAASGKRPVLPASVDALWRARVVMTWHHTPARRPTALVLARAVQHLPTVCFVYECLFVCLMYVN